MFQAAFESRLGSTEGEHMANPLLELGILVSFPNPPATVSFQSHRRSDPSICPGLIVAFSVSFFMPSFLKSSSRLAF